jgi:hypothetical protein
LGKQFTVYLIWVFRFSFSCLLNRQSLTVVTNDFFFDEYGFIFVFLFVPEHNKRLWHIDQGMLQAATCSSRFERARGFLRGRIISANLLSQERHWQLSRPCCANPGRQGFEMSGSKAARHLVRCEPQILTLAGVREADSSTIWTSRYDMHLGKTFHFGPVSDTFRREFWSTPLVDNIIKSSHHLPRRDEHLTRLVALHFHCN